VTPETRHQLGTADDAAERVIEALNRLMHELEFRGANGERLRRARAANASAIAMHAELRDLKAFVLGPARLS
jgi:hypothetical protein